MLIRTVILKSMNSIDETTIDLCLNMFPWASFRKKKGGIKLHVKRNHSGYIPSVLTMTDAKEHEVNQLTQMKVQSGDSLVFDRGYNSFKIFSNYCARGIYFVTRLKSNSVFDILEDYDVDHYENINCDQDIKMAGYSTYKDCRKL
ncbi:transposase [Spirochaeta cellobiosiphila]|uniref:transposase n=1 Tax=Spirochaeta cellobiosiphila TaxID=504483 RepID=UPI000A0564F6|nr:transposase [Spirochaeta cellobiosiphila]